MTSSTEWHQAMARLGKTVDSDAMPVKKESASRMNRTPEWIIERAQARIADRIVVTCKAEDNGDVILHHESTNEVKTLPVSSWSNRDNSDESVRKWIDRRVDHLLECVGRSLKKRKDTNVALLDEMPVRREEVLKAVLPAPAPRKRGRPKGSTKAKKVEQESQPAAV